ncbi:TorD/DmsD family molecular chaperone [Edwardsiella tarda]|uniref:TorD/DmsD family molecular chaperone n=1 Tax=Edwardsiella tarda TaxID=636 RepID=UPI00083A1B26|nr:molecular chaperone [Edwardsiella tarda]
MNEFSMVCRLLGSLFARQPQDPLLDPLFTLLQQNRLAQHWPLEQEALLTRLQAAATDRQALAQDYQALFGADGAVATQRSAYVEGACEQQVRDFLLQRGMPLGSGAADSFAQLLLAASWLEDQAQSDELLAQASLFDSYLMPWAGAFLGKVEAHACTPFYRTLAELAREALQALRDDLAEDEDVADEAGDA